MALPPPVTVPGIAEPAPLKLEGAKAPELLRLLRVSQASVGEPEWNELDVGSPADEPDESGEGLDGMPRPSEKSSLRLPIWIVESGRSTGSNAGDPVALAPTRRGTAGGPIEPLELVTEDLRVRLDPVVAKSSEAAEEASSSAALRPCQGEWREETRLSRETPATVL